MATATVNMDQDNKSKDKKTMLEQMQDIEAQHPELFEALAKDDRSLIRKQ